MHGVEINTIYGMQMLINELLSLRPRDFYGLN
jgi:hypothetical protein